MSHFSTRFRPLLHSSPDTSLSIYAHYFTYYAGHEAREGKPARLFLYI